MTKNRREKIFFIFFIAWVVIWFNFFLRDMTKGKYFKEYSILLSRNDIGKKSWTYGDRLFEFLEFCEKSLPQKAGYDLVGVEYLSIDYRRAVYFLYPHFREDRAEYVLVFDKPGYKQDDYILFKELDPSRFILKRI